MGRLGQCSRYLLVMDRSQRRLLLSIGAGFVVAVLGFGVLNIFYWADGWMRPGPGLYDYWSSSIGDAILLPTVTAALFWLNPRSTANRVDNVIAAIAFGVGLVSGVLLQASWLADSSPVTNWTLPSAHTFTAAGWYHAAFLTLVTATLLAGATRVGVRLARLEWRRGDWVALVILLGASVSFGLLLVVDNVSRRDSQAGAATLVVTSCAVALVGLAAVAIIIRLRLSAQKLGGAEYTERGER